MIHMMLLFLYWCGALTATILFCAIVMIVAVVVAVSAPVFATVYTWRTFHE